MKQQSMGPILGPWFRSMDTTPPDARECAREVMASLPEVHQRGRWWPPQAFDRPASVPARDGRQPAKGFTMFSALKFVAAAAIVALFGGFLLVGTLSTQPGDVMTPAVVTESPSPITVEELLSGMVTEEVEPGVFQVLNDGVRDLTYPLGGWGVTGFLVDVTPDGSVWMSVDEGDHGLFRLGEEPVFEDPWTHLRHRVVAPDGSLWAIGIGGVPGDRGSILSSDAQSGIFSFDGEGWTLRATTTGDPHALAVGPDGTVWVNSGTALLRLEDDGSLTTFDWSDVYGGDAHRLELAVTPDGDVWLVGTRGQYDEGGPLLRFDGEGWAAIPGPEGWGWAPPHMGRGRLEVGADGALWVKASRTSVARFDDPGWTTFTAADGVQPWGEPNYVLTEVLEVAADGSLWLIGTDTAEPEDCCGVSHYDGTTWTSYLVGFLVHDFATAPDGSVWLGAYDYGRAAVGMDSPLQTQTYVITPEAVTVEHAEAVEPPSVEEATGIADSATTTEELLSGMVTEEVEPGVYRVVDDGAGHVPGAIESEHVMPRSLDRLHIEPDGSIWVMTTVYGDDWGKDDDDAVAWEVGVEGRHSQGDGFPGHEYPNRMPSDLTFATAPDGGLWAAGGWGLASFDGEAWTPHGEGIRANTVSVLPDGTVWAAWPDRIGRLGPDGWQWFDTSDGVPMEVYQFSTSPDGRIFAVGSGRLVGFDGSAWRDIQPLGSGADTQVIGLRVAPDGTLWALLSDVTWSHDRVEPWLVRGLATDRAKAQQHYLARFDGDTWTVYSRGDGVPRVSGPDNTPNWEVHPDGSVWVLDGMGALLSFDGSEWTERTKAAEQFSVGPDRSVWAIAPDGVASFDGDVWTRYERPLGSDALDVAPDGTAWLVSNEDGHGLYVITP